MCRPQASSCPEESAIPGLLYFMQKPLKKRKREEKRREEKES